MFVPFLSFFSFLFNFIILRKRDILFGSYSSLCSCLMMWALMSSDVRLTYEGQISDILGTNFNVLMMWGIISSDVGQKLLWTNF